MSFYVSPLLFFMFRFVIFSMSLKAWGRETRKKKRHNVERESETYFLCGKWHHFMYVLCLRHVFCLEGRKKREPLSESCCEERKEAFKIALTDRKRWRFGFFTVRFWAVNDLSRKVIKAFFIWKSSLNETEKWMKRRFTRFLCFLPLCFSYLIVN
jgi:hypothetical protein